MDVSKMTDEELQSTQEEYAKLQESIYSVQGEVARRAEEKQREQTAAKREKAMGTEKFKKLQAKYRETIAGMEELGGEKEVKLEVPINFDFAVEVETPYNPFQGDNGEWQPQTVDEIFGGSVTTELGKTKGFSFSEEQKRLFEVAVEQLNEGDELDAMFPGLQEAQQKAVDHLNKVVTDANESFDKAVAALEAVGAETTSFVLPLTFNVEIGYIGGFEDRTGVLRTVREDEVFEHNGVTVALGKIQGMSKAQHSSLSSRIDEIVQNACDEIYGMFPLLQKAKGKLVADMNKVLDDASEMGLNYDDLNG